MSFVGWVSERSETHRFVAQSDELTGYRFANHRILRTTRLGNANE